MWKSKRNVINEVVYGHFFSLFKKSYFIFIIAMNGLLNVLEYIVKLATETSIIINIIIIWLLSCMR